MNPWETQLRKGLVELAVLATIARRETYGYRIVEELGRLEGLEFTESTVYPVLTRLARDGFLAIRTEPSPAGPMRRYYRLTDGRRAALPPDGGKLEDDFPIPFRVTRRSAMMMTTAAVETSRLLAGAGGFPPRHDRPDADGRVPRQDRLAIVREVEAQVFELLQERDGEDLSREDVLAVLARLDPPEAYLPEEAGVEPCPDATTSRPRAVQPVRKGDPRVAKISGILGLVVHGVSSCSVPLDWADRDRYSSRNRSIVPLS